MNVYGGIAHDGAQDMLDYRPLRGGRAVIAMAAFLSVFFWVVDALVDTYVFRKSALVSEMLFPFAHDTWMRMFMIVLIMAFSLAVGYFIDKKAQDEARLVRSERKYRDLSLQFDAVLNAIPDSMLLLDTDLNVIWANDAFGLETRAVESGVGARCYGLRFFRGTPCGDCPAIRAIDTGEVSFTEFVTARGRVLDLRAIPVPDDDGNVINVIEVASDVTDKVRLQQESMRARQLASLGELAAGVAHEINNPINGIINYAQLIAQRKDEGDRDLEISRRIIREGDRIAAIVRGLLSFAREGAGEKVPGDIVELVRETLLLIDAMMRKDGISVDLALPADLPRVMLRPDQIRQVLLNLLVNARHALNEKYADTHENKRMTISASVRTVSGCAQRLAVTVRDNGVGIHESRLASVFNPFYTTRPGEAGTGLGLSISHGIVAAHGGTMDIRSNEGEFTEVTFELPLGAVDRA